jgi:hypothetical protein
MALTLGVLTCHKAKAEDAEAMFGGITAHFWEKRDVSDKFANKLDRTGKVIDNQLLGFRTVTEQGLIYESKMAFSGTNSVGGPIFGIAGSQGLIVGNARVGVIYGFYLQDNRKFYDRDINPVTMLPTNGWAPAPVIGIELTQKVKLSRTTYLLLNVVATPILVNATAGFGWTIGG